MPLASRVLWPLVGVTTIAGVLVEAGALRSAHSIARVRELGIPWTVRRVAEMLGLNLMSVLPPSVSHPFVLDRWGDLLRFTAGGLLLSLLVTMCMAALLRLALRRAYLRSDRQVALWAGVTVALVASPTVLAMSYGGRHQWHLLFAGAVSAGVSLLAFWVFQGGDRRRLLQALATGSIVALALVVGGGAMASYLAARDSGPPRERARSEQPNVLLISIDSLRRDHLHCYGYARNTSPRLDALAAEGTRFEVVVAPATWTLPSHLTLLTALPPERHGVVRDDLALAPDAISVAQVFQRAGYATAGFVAGPYLDAAYGFARGFDFYDDYTVARASMREAHRAVTSPGSFRIVSRWLRSWDRGGRERPFFVLLHLWDVHADYSPPEPYASMFRPDREAAEAALAGKQVDVSSESLARDISLYDGEIRFTDEYVGRLFDLLRELGIMERTVIVVTGDHGEEFYDHGRQGHHKNLYDETLLVPLLLRFPPLVPAGRVVPALVRLMDIAPTLLALAAVAAPDGFGADGVDAGARDLRELWAAADTPPPRIAFADMDGERGCLRTQDGKVIASDRPEAGAERYNLRLDPGETRNLIGLDPGSDDPLVRKLAAWRGVLRGGSAPPSLRPSAEQEELLRSLGYTR